MERPVLRSGTEHARETREKVKTDLTGPGAKEYNGIIPFVEASTAGNTISGTPEDKNQ
ncbi:hypothetical protein AGMMS50256_22980 [Betaproteobacteria bacterium]|nr:hypothetical protein AGMMS50256_22980 [Betaproteobacteria bacterium]